MLTADVPTANETIARASGLFACNPTFRPVLEADAAVRYIHLWGGRGRGGSYFATEYALACLVSMPYFRGYFMRAVHKDIRESLWRDFMDRYEDKVERGLLNPKDFKINTSTMSAVYLPTGNIIQSRGFRKSAKGQTAKLKSIAGATHVFIEEAEEIEHDDFLQLDDSLRTTKGELRVILIFNPPKKNHWIIEEYYTLTEARIDGYYIARPKVRDNFLSIFSTYHNNLDNIDAGTVANFEDYKTKNPDHYWRVIRGLVSEGAKGRIYKGWKPITSAEFDALPYPSYYVLDFGYSEDPVALVHCKRHNNKRYYKELIYEKGLSDDALAAELKRIKVGGKPIVADSAEPKSIAFLRSKGFNIVKAKKGADSLLYGIKKLQEREVYYTDDSAHLIYEYQEYKWHINAETKKLTDEPEDKNNHIMDGLRYGELTDPWGGGSIDHS